MTVTNTPFHSGEVEAQRRAGVEDLATHIEGFIRDHMPDQHRTFFSSLPFLVVAAQNLQGQPWITIIEGNDEFISSPDPYRLLLQTKIDSHDPLSEVFSAGTEIGMVGIDLATRRRNRMNGKLLPTQAGFEINVGQSFGNCPQYINERSWHRVKSDAAQPIVSSRLNTQQRTFISTSDTMFIGSGRRDSKNAQSNGFDASHRGGAAGFIEVVDDTHLRIPDYAGNNFFNTIGNLLKNPLVALLFVDFQNGSLLHLTGRAEIDWNPSDAQASGAQRVTNVTIDEVIERPAALNLRWENRLEPAQKLSLLRKVPESDNITSFYFGSADDRPLLPFIAGQHLPIELKLAPLQNSVKRSYSLSAASNGKTYRLSIKRETQGLVSRYLHDSLKPGDVIEASSAAGDFKIPAGRDPVVLVSAGVGITPMVAMLEQVIRDGSNTPTWFLHSARNGSAHALRNEVRALTKQNVQTQFFYSQPLQEDRIGQDYDVAGRISPEVLLNLNAGDSANYLLCGPADFVATLQRGLKVAGVADTHIHFETF